MSSLRQRIRKVKIKSQPWKSIGAEIKEFPISSKCLFANDGMPIDVLEMNLKSEGWLLNHESLWEILRWGDINRKHLSEQDDDSSFGDYPADWTEEDFKYHFGEE